MNEVKDFYAKIRFCYYSDAYIVVKGGITATGDVIANTRNKKLNFKNNAPFTSYISKINNTFIDNAEDVDIAISIYNLLEYSANYSMKLGKIAELL